MDSIVVHFITAMLMVIVAVFCSVLWLAWTIPPWRHRLAASRSESPCRAGERIAAPLTGWRCRAGEAIISAGIAACAAISWYGSWTLLTGLIAAFT